MLRDRIVCGINSSKLQQRLLAEKKLTLVKAIDLAQDMETATKNAKALAANGGDKSSEIHRITPKVPRAGRMTGRTQKFTGNCFCCGKTGHKRDECRYKEAICHNCGRKGRSQGSKRTDRQVHKMEDDVTESTDSEDEYELFAINSSKKTN